MMTFKTRFCGGCIHCGVIIEATRRVCDQCQMLSRTFHGMRQRCYNPSNPGYHRYGGRGINIWQPWLDDPSSFVRYCRNVLGRRPDGYTIDRIDNNGDYAPGKVRWASRKEQAANTRRARGPYFPDIPFSEKVRIGGYKSMRKREQETEKAFRRLRDQGEIPL